MHCNSNGLGAARLVILAAVALAVGGCGTFRLSTPKEIDAELAKSAEAHNARECGRKGGDTNAVSACRQQNKQSYEEWRKERDRAKL